MAELRFDVGLDEWDNDFMSFEVIASETDDLPIGSDRENCAKEALERKALEVAKAEEWAKGFGLTACQNILDKFKNV